MFKLKFLAKKITKLLSIINEHKKLDADGVFTT